MFISFAPVLNADYKILDRFKFIELRHVGGQRTLHYAESSKLSTLWRVISPERCIFPWSRPGACMFVCLQSLFTRQYFIQNGQTRFACTDSTKTPPSARVPEPPHIETGAPLLRLLATLNCSVWVYIAYVLTACQVDFGLYEGPARSRSD